MLNAKAVCLCPVKCKRFISSLILIDLSWDYRKFFSAYINSNELKITYKIWKS